MSVETSVENPAPRISFTLEIDAKLLKKMDATEVAIICSWFTPEIQGHGEHLPYHLINLEKTDLASFRSGNT